MYRLYVKSAFPVLPPHGKSFAQYTLSLPPENIRKPYSFLMFSGSRERVHWKRIG